MNCLIAELVFLIIIFLLLILFDKNKEKFFVNNNEGRHDRNDKLGFFSIVNINDTTTEGYDLEKEGPHCVAKCVAEHGPNLLFTNPEGSYDPFYWNKENPRKGYCYRANNKNYPFECDAECKNKCGLDTNNPEDNNGEYDPEKDFSQCDDDDNSKESYLGCKEKKLNFLSGQSCMTTVGCKKCIEKYADNLLTLKNLLKQEFKDSKCEIDSE